MTTHLKIVPGSETAIANEAAVLARMRHDSSGLGDRSRYVGASEVGKCMRAVALGKVDPAEITGKSVHAMRMGQVLESETLDTYLDWLCLENGVKRTDIGLVTQVALEAGPLRAHLDALLYLDEDDAALLVEIKSVGAKTFEKALAGEISPIYETQVKAGLLLAEYKGAKTGGHGVLVYGLQDDLRTILPVSIPRPTDEEAAWIEGRAASIMQAVAEGPDACAALPAEEDRGFCFSCPYKAGCPAMESKAAKRTSKKEQAASTEASFELQVKAEMLIPQILTLQAQADHIKAELDPMRDELKSLMAAEGIAELAAGPGAASITVSKPRETVDTRRLKAEMPEVAAKYTKVGEPTVSLKITSLKGGEE